MKQPKMIIFDYGQTLVDEEIFDGVKGTEAVLEHAITNKYNLSAEQVQEEAQKINTEIGRFNPNIHPKDADLEVHNRVFSKYLYESLGIKLDIDFDMIDRIFWDNASPGKPTDGIEEFLDYLNDEGIRTVVLSNISYSGKVVEERICNLIPGNHFEFIISTSEYLFRKPNKRIFNLVMEKADLKASDIWFVGDNFECDIEGAKEAGMTPIWYRGASANSKDHGDVLKINSWTDLKNIIEEAKNNG